jgi:PAS domain S-box-containing protein
MPQASPEPVLPSKHSPPHLVAQAVAPEATRLETLRRYDILDTPPEEAFDRITSLAARLFNAPTAFISLVDESRVWFKSSHGSELSEMRRDLALCRYALLSEQVLVILDASQDERAAKNPLVQAEPGLSFYAGAPLINREGVILGTLCVLDSQPRESFSPDQQEMLADLAAMVIDELELRLAARKVAEIDRALLAITQGVSNRTGEAYFEALVQHFTQTLGVDYTYIGLLGGDPADAIETLAVCAGAEIVENFAYRLTGSPCQQVIESRQLCCYPSGVQAQFPQAPLLAPMGIESYAAIAFYDSQNQALGLLGVMGRKPLANLHLTQALLPIFALQVAAELERQHTDIARQQVQQHLEQLVTQRTAELSQTNQRLQREIAERQQTEIDLKKEREMQRVLLENMQAGIAACNEAGILTLFNQTARDFHGLPEQPLPSDQWADYYDLYQADGKTRMTQAAIPLFRALQGENVVNAEMVIAPRGGTARTVLSSGRAIATADGQTHGAMVVMHDITERKRAEEERAQLIREQAARLEAEAAQGRSQLLVDIGTALASSLDHTRTLGQVADRVVPYFADWCAIDLTGPETGSEPGPSQGIERVAMAHCDPAKVELGWQMHRQYPVVMAAPSGLAKVLRSGKARLITDVPLAALGAIAQDPEHLRLLRELGPRSCVVVPLVARGKTLGAISFLMAESDRRYDRADLALAESIAHQVAIAVDNASLYQAEQTARSEAEAANRIKDEFLAVLSHELRSPLNPILGWSQLLQKRQPDAATLARGLETIERNAKLQTQLIADLLDVSRILQGKLSLDVAPVNLKTTIEAALETVRLAAEAKAIDICTGFLAATEVLGDAGRLQQVVWNLLANAVKFTPSGGRVEMRLTTVAEAAVPQAQITVTDTGKGITPEVLPFIFERFRQADSKTTRQFGGLGLGLAIARQLAELHGGTIAVTSPGEGLGATFTVQLPLYRSPSLSPGAAAKISAQPVTLTGVRILVAEDEADAREMLVFVLEQAGAIVTPAASGAEALAVLPSLELDLLISDIAMPDMDGYMLLNQMRSQIVDQGKQPSFKAVALTAYAGEINQQQALAAGFQRHLSKPFEPVELVAAIAALLHQ